MKTILYPFMLLAGCGLALSATVHCLSWAGVPLSSLVWFLHGGIFLVWIPAVLTSIQTTRNARRKDFWKIALAGCPVWMRRAFYGIFGYAILNFIVFMATTIGDPRPQRTDNAAPSLSVVRGFSGHWMAFYSAAFVILYSRIYAPELYRERKCPLGHTAAPGARFCSECGYDFSRDAETA